MRRLLFVLPLLLIAILPWLLEADLVSSLGGDPVVLIVGDFSSDDPFSHNVHAGALLAQRKREASTELPLIERIDMRSPAVGAPLSRTGTGLVRAIARRNVIAIVSADTSQAAPITLEIGARFGIPVLLAIATSDGIDLSAHKSALRLIARDQLQASAIAAWCEQQRNQGNEPIGILYDPSRYGTGLRSSLLQRLGPFGFVPFSIGSTSDNTGFLYYGSHAHVKAWVVLGYREQAIEIVGKKVALNLAGPVLLSDGAYGDWLAMVDRPEVYLTFPGPPSHVLASRISAVLPSINARERQQLRGYGAIGFDAYRIIDATLQRLLERGGGRHRMPSALPGVADEVSQAGATLLRYSFRDGENVAAGFSMFEVRDGSIP